MTADRKAEPMALEVENVNFSYGRDQRTLEDVGFSVPQSAFTALLGPNGAGKTTLMALITRLFQTRTGRIRVLGAELATNPRMALTRMGVVFQQLTLDLDLSIDQNLRYTGALYGLDKRRVQPRIDAGLERFGLSDRRDAPVRTLSGGLRRRVELVRALLHEPRLLVLDEPTVGLDIDSRTKLVEEVHALCRNTGLAVLWTTHLIDEIWPEDRLVVLHRGRVQAAGSVHEVLARTGRDDLGAAFASLTGEKPLAAERAA